MREAREAQEVREALEAREFRLTREAREVSREASETEEEKLLRERGKLSPFSKGGLTRTPPKGFGSSAVTPPATTLVAPTGGRPHARPMTRE